MPRLGVFGMATTSLELFDELKQRAAEEAARQVLQGAFMVSEFDLATIAAAKRAKLLADAVEAREQVLVSGEGYEAGEVRHRLKARMAGRGASTPKATDSAG